MKPIALLCIYRIMSIISGLRGIEVKGIWRASSSLTPSAVGALFWCGYYDETIEVSPKLQTTPMPKADLV